MIYSKNELQVIGEWVVKNDILIVVDDIYGCLVYNGNEFILIVMILEVIKNQIIIINGVFKIYVMIGWCIGYVVGNFEIINGMIVVVF